MNSIIGQTFTYETRGKVIVRKVIDLFQPGRNSNIQAPGPGHAETSRGHCLNLQSCIQTTLPPQAGKAVEEGRQREAKEQERHRVTHI